MHRIDDAAYGGFVVSKRIYEEGRPIRYSYREKSPIPQLNGWTLYSCDDDDAYVNDPQNFIIIGATTMHGIAPVMLEVFDAPYGTDLCWLYKGDRFAGFWDLVADKKTSIRKILKHRQTYDE